MSIGQDELLLVEKISQFKQSQCHTETNLEYLIKTMLDWKVWQQANNFQIFTLL